MNDCISRIRELLYQNQDLKYRDFNINLTPALPPSAFIGVRTPIIRNLAKDIEKWDDIDVFLSALPHQYFEENQIHMVILSRRKKYEQVLAEIKTFLPYVNNWATCDSLKPTVFAKNLDKLESEIPTWLASDHTYTRRFGIEMLMNFYLDQAFDPKYPDMVAVLRSDEYYVNMMIAWYFATALAKHYDEILPYIRDRKLDIWTHNKTIQKAVESYRISAEQKDELRAMRIKA
ncbi:MAG TPA: DNA alkylation repair protein [Bacillota bacterium]|nr:DNA alkylation repair protein [Bacillota bacterium]